MPPCPICGIDLDSDGDFLVCHRCQASWGSNGSSGRWHNPFGLRCLATAKPYRTIQSAEVAACTLHRGHDLEGEEYSETHQSGFGLPWTDGDPRALTDTDGEDLA